jgi:hypothetical protein
MSGNYLATMSNNFQPGEWVKMSAPGFVIYGLCIQGAAKGQIRFITSSVVEKQDDLQAGAELKMVRVRNKDVPPRCRAWILARASRTDQPEVSKNIPAQLLPPDWEPPVDQ